jgi:hypothetical protein
MNLHVLISLYFPVPPPEKGEVRDGAGRDHLVLTAGTEATALQLVQVCGL